MISLCLLLLAANITLPMSSDAPMMNTIQDILDEYEYTRPYSSNDFDCTDRSMLVWEILHDYNYRPVLFVDTIEKEWHMWIGLQDRHDEWMMVETTWHDDTLGEVVMTNHLLSPYLLIEDPQEMTWICNNDTMGIVNANTMEWAKKTLIKKN